MYYCKGLRPLFFEDFKKKSKKVKKKFANTKIICIFATTKTNNDMKNTNYCTISDSELLAMFNKALNAESVEEKENRRRAKIRRAKADFFNLDATDYCKFVEA